MVQANATTDNVKATLAANTDALGASVYAIGVVSLNSSLTAPAKFVKIDGVSPNFNANGTPAYKLRTRVISGDYPFAMVSTASYPTKPVKKSVNDPIMGYPDVLQAVITGMQDSTLHDLQGMAYLDGAADAPGMPKQSKVHRTNGNNCSPLVVM